MPTTDEKPAPKPPTLANRLTRYLHRHRRGLLAAFFIVFFLATFIISVSGGLRVFFPYLGELTGFPFGQKNYLVIFQNNNELRPAGGFISSFGKVQLTAGLPTLIQIEDVYGEIDEHERLTAPWPMEKLLANEWYTGYSFRDGNYSPDFPASAEELIRLYRLTRPTEQIDGVVAIDFRILENLLDTLGPIEVEGRFLSRDNLFEELTNQVNDVDRHNLESLAGRKSVLKPLANAIIRKIVLNPFKLRKVSDVITRGMATKDIQLYFTNANLQQLARRNGWAGEWPRAVAGDFLAVNEANLGGMKSDRYITRHVTYHVRLSEEYFTSSVLPEAELQVEIHHFGIENIPLSGPYSGFFRLYNSPAQLEQAFSTQPPDSRPALPADSAGLPPAPAIEEIVKLRPGEKTSFSARYQLPRQVVKDGIYSLYIPKQAGTESDLYTIIIELPRGYRTESDSFSSRENFGFYQGQLTKDLELSLKIIEDTTPPRLILQQNVALNQISLHFNEDLNQNFAADPFSYEVRDLDIKHPEKNDTLTIREVKTTSKDVILYLNGQTAQPEERYSVRLKNLRDTHGNILSDREITVVQRLQ